MTRYDAVVVGSGAGGGIAASLIARAGKRVLLLERGRAVSFEEAGRDHLRNHRFSRYPHRTGPDLEGAARMNVDPTGRQELVQAFQPGFHNNATLLGGGTRVYGAQAWRFLPADFAMASEYGVPAHSSLADWPISYEDLAQCYERAEWEVGVCGDHVGSSRYWPRDKGYPMPPLPDGPKAEALRRGAAQLDWSTVRVPLLINSIPYQGRAACTRCQHCVGFICPVDAKNGSATFMQSAVSSGNLEVLTQAVVTHVECGAGGRATGVRYVDRAGVAHTIDADVVICAAGAIETARLLLNSRTVTEPAGLGNNHDQLGRHLQGHAYPHVFGEMTDTVHEGMGPGVSVATLDFAHGNPNVIGGAMLADEFTVLPIEFWARNLPPGLPTWGFANKRYMRENYRRVMRITGPVQEIPNPHARVRLEHSVLDQWGVPVARLSGSTHPETLRTASVVADRAEEWLWASGATRVWAKPLSLALYAGQHQAGTCRMGEDPKTSVVDQWGRVHGHENVYVMDASVHVTNGSVNPVLTVMALAMRSTQHLIDDW